MSCDSLLCGKGRFYMKKYENFCSALCNMKEIYKYDPPYDTVILTGLVGLFEVCFEQSWKMMKEILESHGYEEGTNGSPKIILKTGIKQVRLKMRNCGFVLYKKEIMWHILIMKELHEVLLCGQKNHFMICFVS